MFVIFFCIKFLHELNSVSSVFRANFQFPSYYHSPFIGIFSRFPQMWLSVCIFIPACIRLLNSVALLRYICADVAAKVWHLHYMCTIFKLCSITYLYLLDFGLCNTKNHSCVALYTGSVVRKN